MKLPKVFLGLVVALLIAFVGTALVFERVDPAEIGVKQSLWGGGGVFQQDYESGFHVGITGIHKWHRLDKRTHFLTFTSSSPIRRPSSGRYSGVNRQHRPPLEIRTRDNNTASLDVSLTYHIVPGEGHELVAQGLKNDYRERVVSTVEGVLREELAKLAPEDFVETDVRLKRVEDTMPILEAALSKFHVAPDALLIRAVRFPDSYEKKLQDKQLQQQLALLETSNERVEVALTITGTIEKETGALEKQKVAEWDKKLQQALSENRVTVAEILGEARKYDQRVRAEAEAEYKKMVAEGDLALAQAEALRDELRNAALDTLGGRILQARDAAENLRFDSVTLNSNDPSIPSVIDIDALVGLLVGEEPEARAAAGD